VAEATGRVIETESETPRDPQPIEADIVRRRAQLTRLVSELPRSSSRPPWTASSTPVNMLGEGHDELVAPGVNRVDQAAATVRAAL
jgi:hypothetical protein